MYATRFTRKFESFQKTKIQNRGPVFEKVRFQLRLGFLYHLTDVTCHCAVITLRSIFKLIDSVANDLDVVFFHCLVYWQFRFRCRKMKL